jgi:hypothetical protein
MDRMWPPRQLSQKEYARLTSGWFLGGMIWAGIIALSWTAGGWPTGLFISVLFIGAAIVGFTRLYFGYDRD